MGRDPWQPYPAADDTAAEPYEPLFPGGRVSERQLPLRELDRKPSEPALVFAYGSNMQPRQMAERCPGATPVGAATLSHHRLDFVGWSSVWKGGVATVTPRFETETVPPKAADVFAVEGVLWRLAAGGLDRLDGYEAHPTVYRREIACVSVAGGSVLAWLYRHQRPTLCEPSKAYVNALTAGAREFGLSTKPISNAAARARRSEGLRLR